MLLMILYPKTGKSENYIMRKYEMIYGFETWGVKRDGKSMIKIFCKKTKRISRVTEIGAAGYEIRQDSSTGQMLCSIVTQSCWILLMEKDELLKFYSIIHPPCKYPTYTSYFQLAAQYIVFYSFYMC
jgi:hypothetical protein